MASNAIGTGAVVLTANADNFLGGLRKAQQETEKWADRTRKAVGSAGAAIDKSFGKAFEEAGKLFLELPMKFAALSIAQSVKDLGTEFIKSSLGLATAAEFSERLNKELAEGADAADKIVAKFAELRADATGKGDLLRVGAGEAGELRRKLDEFNAERDKALAAGKQARNLSVAARVSLKGGSFIGLSPSAADIEQIAAEGVAGLDANIEKVQKRLEAIDKEKRRALNPDIDPAKIRAVDTLANSLETQAVAMREGADAARLFQMRLDGFSESQIDRVKQALDKLADESVAKRVNEANLQLQRQIVLLREGERAAERFQARLDGLTEADIAAREKLLDEVGFAKTENKIQEIEKSIKRQVALWGASASQVDLYDIMLGKVSGRQADIVKNLLRQRDAVNATLTGLSVALGVGMGLGKMVGEAAESAGKLQASLAGALTSESAEAYSVVAKFQAGNTLAGLGGAGASGGPTQLAKEQLREMKEMKRELRRIEASLSLGSVVRVAK